jgi:hypothetical protein
MTFFSQDDNFLEFDIDPKTLEEEKQA